MIITDSQAFYKDLKDGRRAIMAYLYLENNKFRNLNQVAQYIICDAEHYQYFQDEMQMYLISCLGKKSNRIGCTVQQINIDGGIMSIIIRVDTKGINLFAKNQ
jgi:hypothetical protein